MSETNKRVIQEDPINFWEHIEQLDRLIRAAELKAGLILSFHSLFLGIIIDKINEVSEFMEQGIIYKLAILAWFIMVAISLYFALNCFRPKMELNFSKNVFFFRDAIREFGDIQSFKKTFLEINKDASQLYGQLSEQIFIQSKIIDYKFSTVQRAIKFLYLSFMWLVALVISYLILT